MEDSCKRSKKESSVIYRIEYTFPADDGRYPSRVSGAENKRRASSMVRTASGQISRCSERNGWRVAEGLFPAQFHIINWIRGDDIKKKYVNIPTAIKHSALEDNNPCRWSSLKPPEWLSPLPYSHDGSDNINLKGRLHTCIIQRDSQIAVVQKLSSCQNFQIYQINW